jgi:hypothetical protein
VTSIILGRGALILEKRVTKERRVIVDPSGNRLEDPGRRSSVPNRGGSRVRQAGPPTPAGMALRLTCFAVVAGSLFGQVPYGEAMGETVG